MPVAGAAGTPGWFADTNPAAITRLDADWFNMVQGELTNLVTGMGGTLTKGVVDQLATLIVDRLTVHGNFSASVVAGDATDYVEMSKLFGFECFVAGVKTAWLDRSGSASFVDTTIKGVLEAFSLFKAYGKICNAAGADVVFDDGIDVEGNAQVRGKVKNAAGADVVFDDGVEVEAGLKVGGKITVKNAAVSEDFVDCILVDWTSGGADHACASAPATVNAAPNASFVVKLGNSGSATTINPGDAILVDISSIEATGQTLLAAHAEVINIDPGTWETLAALRGLRLTAGMVHDSSGAARLALTYVGRGNLTVAGGATQGQAFIRVRLQYATLTATT